LTHPRHGVPKRYAVVVAGQVEADSLRRLQRGIHLAEGRAKVDHAKLKRIRKGCTELEITLSEGKNREIRRVLARLGHKVVSLKRIGIGPLKLGELPEGAYRPLGTLEINALYEAVEAIKRERKQERKERKKEAEKPKGVHTSKQPKSRGATTEKPEDFALPPLQDNPYHTDEDLDDEQNPFGDEAILVRDTQIESDDDWTPTSSRRVGAVIGDEEVVPNNERRRDGGERRDGGKGKSIGKRRDNNRGASARGDSETGRTEGRPLRRTKSARGRNGDSERVARREGHGGTKKKGFGRPGIKASRKGRPASKKRRPKGR
jgi:23S rRNA pseudouridine2605 synthase